MADGMLARWNALTPGNAAEAIVPCCGSLAWARGMAARRPFGAVEDLLRASAEVWFGLGPEAWEEAFQSHPRIGERRSAETAEARSQAWSEVEQRSAAASTDASSAEALADGNRRYEAKFGRVFLICASGRTAAEVLAEMDRRTGNAAEVEVQEAAEEQSRIASLRIERWIAEGGL